MAASLLVLVASAVLAQTPDPPPAKPCPTEATLQVSDPARPAVILAPRDRRGPAGAQTLASLPPAGMHLTVMRAVGGCAISTQVRQNVQGDGRFARPR